MTKIGKKLKADNLISGAGLLYQAFSQFKRQIVFLSILGVVSGLLEGIGVNVMIPIFAKITKEENIVPDIISRGVEWLFAFLHIDFRISYLIIFIVILFIAKALVTFWAQYVNVKITTAYEKQMRSTLFQAMLRTRWPFLLKQKIGHLEKVIIDDISNASTALLYLSASILLATSMLIYVVIAFSISASITLLALLTGAVLFLIMKPLLFKTRRAAQNLTVTSKDSAHHINEHMIGIKSVKSFSVEDKVGQRADLFFDRLRDARIKLALYNNGTVAIIQPISVIFVLAVFSYYFLAGDFNLAAFAVILYLIQKIFQYVQTMQNRLHSIYELIPNLRYVISYQQGAKRHHEKNQGKAAFNLDDKLEFRGVNFGYSAKSKSVLKNISFTINRGEMFGLIGRSGSGKTTVVDLLLGLFLPDKGKIIADGKKMSDIDLIDWRDKIGYVSQDIFLLNDTIINNIKFYDDKISTEQVVNAAKMAQIHDFVKGTSKAYQTVIGERGVRLSGGQRQRIILARALARQPKLLILDEATSSLDTESERLVQKAIELLKGKMTVIAIAHRLSTVMNSDQLLILKDGQIKEKGDPKKLLKDINSYVYKNYNLRAEPL
jgi:ATP-binding cassette, subfamily C, bacterial